jgi:histidinol phosphatase-like enzyme/predicted kinase
LTDSDRAALDDRFPAGRLLRVPRSVRRPPDDEEGDVVLVMGIPAAGKSTVASELVACGYRRLNRDTQGGRLADLVHDLDASLASGRSRFVLDNTYATRRARNEVIECAWRHGVPARCIRLTTSTPEAQINAVARLIEAHGHLPSPEELRTLGKRDHRFFGPDAQFRYERTLEPPVLGEGFTAVEQRTFVRHRKEGFDRKALLIEYDGVLCDNRHGVAALLDPDDIVIAPARRATLAGYHARGWVILAHAWRPQISLGKSTGEAVKRCVDRTRELLGLDIDISWCPHPAGPPICWCRKPLPGLMLEFAFRYRLDLQQSIVIGRSPADRTLAERLGMGYRDARSFFASSID